MGLSYFCNLPQGSALTKKLNNDAMAVLYNSVPHPPATFLGTDAPLSPTPVPPMSSETWGNGKAHTQVSTANGQAAGNGSAATKAHASAAPPRKLPRLPISFWSTHSTGNNVLMPNLGKAGMLYARTVQNKHPFAVNTLPDPGLIFDTLLNAREVRFLMLLSMISCMY